MKDKTCTSYNSESYIKQQLINQKIAKLKILVLDRQSELLKEYLHN